MRTKMTVEWVAGVGRGWEGAVKMSCKRWGRRQNKVQHASPSRHLNYKQLTMSQRNKGIPTRWRNSQGLHVHLKLPPQFFHHTALACNGKLGVGRPTQSLPPASASHTTTTSTTSTLPPFVLSARTQRKCIKKGSRTWVRLFLSFFLSLWLWWRLLKETKIVVRKCKCCATSDASSQWTMQSGSASLICHGDLVCRWTPLCLHLWRLCFDVRVLSAITSNLLLCRPF